MAAPTAQGVKTYVLKKAAAASWSSVACLLTRIATIKRAHRFFMRYKVNGFSLLAGWHLAARSVASVKGCVRSTAKAIASAEQHSVADCCHQFFYLSPSTTIVGSDGGSRSASRYAAAVAVDAAAAGTLPCAARTLMQMH